MQTAWLIKKDPVYLRMTMTEGARGQFTDFDTGHNPADPVDQAIMATRKAVFPLHGLMP